jgi:hypothetical protein
MYQAGQNRVEQRVTSASCMGAFYFTLLPANTDDTDTDADTVDNDDA